MNERMAISSPLKGNICHFFHLFLIVEYATNFQMVSREGKRRKTYKYCQNYAKEVDLRRSSIGLF